MEGECIFCKIIAGESEAKIIYQDEDLTAFWDQFPAAKVHILIVPNKHIDSMNKAGDADEAVLGKMLLKARDIAKEQGIDKSGYRLLINTERGGGQSVFHLHLHMIGGPHMLAIHA